MNESTIDVRYVAKLARLALEDAEVARYEQELGAILGYVAELAELPLETIDGTALSIAPEQCREDSIVPGLTREAFLAGVPAQQAHMVRVPRIIAEAE